MSQLSCGLPHWAKSGAGELKSQLPDVRQRSADTILCAGQRPDQEGSSPSGARMRGAIGKGRSIKQVIEELNPKLQGWLNYFRYVESDYLFKELDGWLPYVRWCARTAGETPPPTRLYK